MRAVAVIAVALATWGCKVSATFTCDTNDQCGVGGTCEPNFLCSFPDAICGSGRRYGDYSGELSGVCVGDEPRPDGPPTVDSPGVCATWHPTHFRPCEIPGPSGPLDIAGIVVYDTSTAMFGDGSPGPANTVIAQDGVEARVISVSSLTIAPSGILALSGAMPLIIAVWGSVQIDGGLSAGSLRGMTTGPGANSALCDALAPGQDAMASGGSGAGGGGGFGGAGGDGGPGDNPTVIPGGPGGAAIGPPLVVRGGCGGGKSGNAGVSAVAPATPSSVSLGGDGGGAVEVAALGDITITGVVAAGGAGGPGSEAGSSCGGGGGGSGGYIGLDATTVLISGIIAANGGGGGASQAFAVLAGGDPGDDASASDVAAAGGAATSCAVAGGAGSARAAVDGQDVTAINACGGGGGGGGAGFILVWAEAANYTDAVLSPGLQLNPY